MNTILQGVQDVEGVLAVLAIDGSGQIAAYQSNPVYDRNLLEQAARQVMTTVDSIHLLREDWESVTVNFREGRLLLRNLVGKDGPPKNGLAVLAVAADARLNLSFAGVALRVAASKLKNAPVSSGPVDSSSTVEAAAPFAIHAGAGLTGSNPRIVAAPAVSAVRKPEIATAGLSWSGVGGSSMAGSGVSVADAASAAFLDGCTTALAKSVGPLAKALVKEAVHKLWPDRPFSRELGPALAAELETHIDSTRAQSQFRTALRSL